jgi:AAA domain-containing protein
MSSTRYAKSEAASDDAPERFLASDKVRGINIGLNVITRVARAHPERERSAMIWLHNYSREEGLTADALSSELDLSKPDIRAALTDPDIEPQLMTRFVRQVEALRKKFVADLPSMYSTKPYRILTEALALAKEKPSIIEVVGLTRMGKSIPAKNWYLRHALDCGLFFTCPEDEADRTFLAEMLRVAGINFSKAKKNVEARPQLRSIFGKNAIRVLIVDEAHFLWPKDVKTKPKRIEFLRGLHDMFIPAQVSILILATPQHTLNMNIALDEHNRWAPGQYDGRVIRYHFPDTMSDADLRGVAKLHAPDFGEGMIDGLVLHAKATAGFCGAMVNAIELAKFKASERGTRVTRDILLEAQEQMIAGTKLAQMVKEQKKGNVRELRRAA